MKKLMLAMSLAGLVACGGTSPQSDEDKSALESDCQAARKDFQAADAGLKKWFDTAHGYAIFPNVGKGGLIVGGAHGRGQVYEKGAMIGWSTMTEASIGLQAGGQAFREVIFFKDASSFKNFKEGNFELAANASAVAASKGASTTTDYSNGVAIFTVAKGGLMAEAAVAGQKFKFETK